MTLLPPEIECSAARLIVAAQSSFRAFAACRWKRAAVVAALGLAFSSVLFAQQQWRWSGASRIVVVADVHGAHSELARLLQATGIADAALDWAGGDATLVSLGDLLDRGAESRKVMDLLIRLQREAPAHGGAVHVVLGNHELMNLTGDLRYVSAAEFAAFADEEPAGRRQAAYDRFLLQQAEALSEDQGRAAFERRYPPGYFGHRLAFEADGRYGGWLLSLPSLIVVDETAFVHGGLSDIVANAAAGDINRQTEDKLRRYLSIRSQLADAGALPPDDMQRDADVARAALLASDGASSSLLEELIDLGESPEIGLDSPFWYRGSVYCNAVLERPVLEAALGRIGAQRVVVGHTPTEDRRARTLYDGKLIMLDTGMLTEYYAGRPAALVLENGRSVVQYLDPDERLPLDSGRVEAYGLTEVEIVEALRAGTIESGGSGDSGSDRTSRQSGSDRTSRQSGSERPLRVGVRHDGKVVRAIFYPQMRAAALELAAHALDRLLGLNLVPPTIERVIDGQQGALQLEYPDAVTESERLERRVPIAGWCPLDAQFQLMYAFDALIYNTGRTRDDIVYRPELSVLKLVDHGRTFGTARRVRLADGALTLPAALEDALASLDRQQIESALGDWIDSGQTRALLARRDSILDQDAGE
jgi:hypothetical protein